RSFDRGVAIFRDQVHLVISGRVENGNLCGGRDRDERSVLLLERWTISHVTGDGVAAPEEERGIESLCVGKHATECFRLSGGLARRPVVAGDDEREVSRGGVRRKLAGLRHRRELGETGGGLSLGHT